MIHPIFETLPSATTNPGLRPAAGELRRRPDFAALLKETQTGATALPEAASQNSQPVLLLSDKDLTRIAPAPPPKAGSLPPGFVRSESTEGPVRFAEVPGHLKSPLGPYVQAPPESGGEWWYANPFIGPRPWLILEPRTEVPETLPAGFEELFGPRPARTRTDNSVDFAAKTNQWEQSLKHFKGVGIPDGIEPAEIDALRDTMEKWGLGEPRFYEGRYGWRVRFPDSRAPSFEMNPKTLVTAPQLSVSMYQIRLLKDGILPEPLHAMVPPGAVTDLFAPENV